MQASLALTAVLMGLAGGPHCVAMCGGACAGIGQAAGPQRGRALLGFQAGRLAGYSALGGVAAASLQGLGWLGTQSAALRPAWTLLHVAALLLGLLLLVRARQPLWLDAGARGAWHHVRRLTASHARGAPLAVGALWALLPCGLLYSALMVAALSGSALQGMGVMALFALGSGASLLAGPWLWLRWAGARNVALASTGASRGRWGVRVAGAALAVLSAWALYQGLVNDMAPWCVTPAATAL